MVKLFPVTVKVGGLCGFGLTFPCKCNCESGWPLFLWLLFLVTLKVGRLVVKGSLRLTNYSEMVKGFLSSDLVLEHKINIFNSVCVFETTVLSRLKLKQRKVLARFFCTHSLLSETVIE